MPIVLCRVDDRLVHGQVVIGWGRPLAIQLIVLVDDTVAASPWEQDLYRMAVSPEIELRFDTIAEASARLEEWQTGTRRTLVLTGDLPTMAALHAADPTAMHHINLGGVHHRAGRRERLPYLYLSDDELKGLLALEAAGADIQAQDLPTSPPVPLRALA
jgi:PTS system mannose-specific IIB component/fructoselysine and glucoselysine-specific PTS system IIB component